jgi:dihydroorotate dehydrogenase electron transfer subunit
MLKYKQIKIEKIITESESTKTFVFHHLLQAQPGQFIMMTDFETGEKPFSLSFLDELRFSVTVKKVGKFTSRLCELKEGDKLYIRGPYGTSFNIQADNKIEDRNLLVIGGGCGIAPLRFLIYKLKENRSNKIDLVLGGRKSSDLLFLDEFKTIGINICCVTEDGSSGINGTAVDELKARFNSASYDYFYASGPELMLKNIYEYLKNKLIDGDYLLERYMKCGIGICGQCTIDPLGLRMCIEGPVLKKDTVSQLTEFGNYTRDVYGSRRNFVESPSN